MANHAATKKDVRQSTKRNERNRYYGKTTRNAIRDIRALEENKADIGWGSQIRSYVLDQSRVKDLRTYIETTDTSSVLDGLIDFFIEASLKEGL